MQCISKAAFLILAVRQNILALAADCAGPIKEMLSARRWNNAAACPLKNLKSTLLFELLDRAAQARLGGLQIACCLAE